MTSWVYLFAKFTPEALLLEGLLVSFLITSYSAYWILKKRRYGVLEANVPANVIKGYLSELIIDAEQMRAQLFGLLRANAEHLRSNSKPINISTAANADEVVADFTADPQLGEKIALLEAKIDEQTKAMVALTNDKLRIEKELVNAKAASKSVGGFTSDPAAANEFKSKVQALEAKLAEYSVIEDDLANLKRLQQENAQLRSQLGMSANQAPAPQAPASQVAAPVATPAPTPAPEAVAENPGPSFDNLVNQVEESLQQPTAEPVATQEPVLAQEPAVTQEPAVATEALAPEPAVTQEPAIAEALPLHNPEKKPEANDADLVAEFEKMLNA